MKKKLIITSVFLLTLILTSAFISQYSSGTADNEITKPAPYFNVNVSRVGARVDYKQGGVLIHSGLTGNDGVYYTSLNSGTYDIYVYFPDRPNDSSSGSLIGHYHNGDETVNVPVTVFY